MHFFIFSYSCCHPDLKVFLSLPASAADATAVNPNDIKVLLGNGWRAFCTKGKPIFSNGPRDLPRNPSDCTILDSWVLDNDILAN